MNFKSLFVLTSLSVCSFAETSIAQVQKDISNQMASAVINFSTTVHAFPIWGGTAGQAMSIHYSAIVLNNVIANTTNDMNNIISDLSDADCLDILGHLQALEPSFLHSIEGLAIRKPAFEVLPLGNIPALLKLDLATMKTSADSFMDGFIRLASPNVLPAARAMKVVVDSTFTTVLAIYNI
ncbi:hypothetical protein H2248_002276 [Termitomyces sp. 'cryptogamus']|nr:hypothetical protein H2248_002276 [Termitomyces sp. 'cryptogamus']